MLLWCFRNGDVTRLLETRMAAIRSIIHLDVPETWTLGTQWKIGFRGVQTPSAKLNLWFSFKCRKTAKMIYLSVCGFKQIKILFNDSGNCVNNKDLALFYKTSIIGYWIDVSSVYDCLWMFSQGSNMNKALALNSDFTTNFVVQKQIKLVLVLVGEWYIWQIHDTAIQI